MGSQISSKPHRVTPLSYDPVASWEEVDHRAQLQSRPQRIPDHIAEHRALRALATEMAENPRNMLQKLVETALELCRADTAGISILEGEVFRWVALAGVFAAARNTTMPRDASPCGICVLENSTQLMHLPDRHFPALAAEPRFVETLLIPFHEQGKPVGTVWIVAHNEERKFDREDERIVETLAQFAAAGWQLWKAYGMAAELNRKKDEFLATLGHELRNPLSAIVGAAAIIGSIAHDDPKVPRMLAIIDRQAGHLHRLVDDLLDLSRINRGKLEIRMEPVDFRAIIEQVVETMQAKIDGHHHRLQVHLPTEPIRIDGDPGRLAQLFSNLLDNAVKFTPGGGEISVIAEVSDDQLTVAVCDNGIGIEEERLVGIFDLFTQQYDLPDKGDLGIGLGLALVRALADAHGGTVTVMSAGLGKGSQFTVWLPISSGSSSVT